MRRPRAVRSGFGSAVALVARTRSARREVARIALSTGRRTGRHSARERTRRRIAARTQAVQAATGTAARTALARERPGSRTGVAAAGRRGTRRSGREPGLEVGALATRGAERSIAWPRIAHAVAPIEAHGLAVTAGTFSEGVERRTRAARDVGVGVHGFAREHVDPALEIDRTARGRGGRRIEVPALRAKRRGARRAEEEREDERERESGAD